MSTKLIADLPELTATLPNFDACPVRAAPPSGQTQSPTEVLLDFGAEVNRTISAHFPQCDIQVESFQSLQAMTFSHAVSLPALDVNASVFATIPAGSLWGYGAEQLLADSGATSLIVVTMFDCGTNGEMADSLATSVRSPGTLHLAMFGVRCSYLSTMS